jgi:hypothetical protein
MRWPPARRKEYLSSKVVSGVLPEPARNITVDRWTVPVKKRGEALRRADGLRDERGVVADASTRVLGTFQPCHACRRIAHHTSPGM